MSDRTKFCAAHATAATWQEAAADIVVRLGSLDARHRLGFLYVTDAFADSLADIAIFLRQMTGVPHWVGTVGLGVCGTGREYFDTPALAVLVAPIREEGFRIFALPDDDAEAVRRDNADWLSDTGAPVMVVHADPRIGDPPALIRDLSAATNGFLVGGMTASRGPFAQLAGGVAEGTASGVMLSPRIAPVQTGLTQGCSPIGPPRSITGAEQNVLFTIDGRPALEVLKDDIGELLARDLNRIAGYIFAALPVPGSDTGDYLVRNIVGIEENEGAVAIAENISAGDQILFCRRDRDSAIADLRRMLDDLKRRVGDAPIRGGLYHSCVARGPNQFGPNSAELGLIREVLGDFPLAGFFASAEISNDRLYSYTGVLTLFL